MIINGSEVWAGTEESFNLYVKSEEMRAVKMAAGSWGSDDDDDEEDDRPRLLEVRDGVGYLTIHGPLVNSADTWWNKYAGLTGYPEIRDALVSAAGNPEVQHIFLDISSGGGAVSGLSDTAKLVRLIHDNLKPVTAFTDASMYSAAYWLGSSAGKTYASEGAGIGSIGVIATHMERSKMLADNGIGVTVVRAGKWKALANGVEKLSEEGKAQIQAGVDAAYKLFVTHVAEMRGKSYEYADQTMAQGREFYGQAAADAGLVDNITTFDTLVGEIHKKLMDASNSFMDNRGRQAGGLTANNGDEPMKKPLTPADLAALASGVTLDAEAASKGAEIGAEETQAEGSQKDEASTKATDTSAVKTEAVVQDVANLTAQLKVLNDQLALSQDALLASKLESSKLSDKMATLEATLPVLKEIAVKAVNNMRVACNSSVMDLASAGADQVVREYQLAQANFEKKFVAGGVAAVDATQTESKARQAKGIDAKFSALVKATGLVNRK